MGTKKSRCFARYSRSQRLLFNFLFNNRRNLSSSLLACNMAFTRCSLQRTSHQNSGYTTWSTQRFACDSWLCASFICCCSCYIKIKIVKFRHCYFPPFILLLYQPVIWHPHVTDCSGQVIRIPVTQPDVHKDMLVILGCAPPSSAVVAVTSRSKSSNFAIVIFLLLFFYFISL